MNLLESLGNWLENVAEASITRTYLDSKDERLTDAEIRVIESARGIRAVGEVLNGNHNKDYSYEEED